MGYYLVTWKGQSMSFSELESGYDLWRQTLAEFPEIKDLHTFGNLSEGHILCVFQAPSIDDIRLLDDRFKTRWMEVHGGKTMKEDASEVGMDILPLDFYYEGAKLVFKPEMARV